MLISAVAVDVALPHLDRTFDYRVPNELASQIAVGMRVRVAFAGKLKTGIVLELHEDASRATSELRGIVSPAIVLPRESAELIRAVAARYAGSFADVVRFAVPPRHAKTEADALARELPPPPTARPLAGPLEGLRGVSAFIERVGRGEALAACLEVPAQHRISELVADAAVAIVQHASVAIVVPDARDVTDVLASLKSRGIAAIAMRASDGPAARQRAFTVASQVTRGVVVGTRSAVFAPLQGKAVTIVVSDGNDSLVEVQSPGWHVREVALLRGETANWSTLFIGRHRAVELQAAVESGRVKALQWSAEYWRSHGARVEVAPERYDGADPMLQRLRIPPSVFKAIRAAIVDGPVVLSVAHRGYINSVHCSGCREVAKCGACGGAIAVAANSELPRCTLCGSSGWQCPWCSSTAVRFSTIGVERTRDELGRAFPGVPVRVVDADHPLERMGDEPVMLFVTPGMEPAGDAALAVILDADAVLARHDLSASVEAFRRWSDVAATAAVKGRVVVVGSASAPAIQALVRNDPVGFAERELAVRRSAGLPPAQHALVLEAAHGSGALEDLVSLIPTATVLGPVPSGDLARWVLLSSELAALAAAARAFQVKRSAAKTLAGIRLRIDPLVLAT